jgi:outer membrane lipoprotein SlyB
VVVREVVEHKTVVHDKYVQHAATPHHQHQTQYTQFDAAPRYAPAPVYQQPSASSSNSPIGMGIGAVVGGLVGSQVGGGNGKTLATIAGAVGGGYLGNEVAKRNF